MGICSISLLYALVICLGSVLVGSVGAYTSPTGKQIRDRHHLSDTDFKFSFYSSIAFLGAAFGPFVTKFLLNIFKGKRKNTMFVIGVSACISWLLNCLTKINIYGGWVARFLLGFSCGSFSSITAMYLIEIAPKGYEGFYGSLNTVGTFLAQALISFLGPFLDYMEYNYLCAAIALLLSISIWFIKESPLITQDTLIEKKKKTSILQKKYVKSLFVGSAVMFVQQFSGFSGILANLADIFRNAGLNFDPNYQSGIAILFLLFANLAGSIMIDKLGQRFQWILSCSIAFCGCMIMGLNDKYQWSNILPLICIFAYNIGFGLGIGSIPWLIVLDLFDEEVKEIGNTICVELNWCFAFLLVMVFPSMLGSIGMFGSMMFFAVVCIFGLCIGVFMMKKPEIKDVENADISDPSDPSDPSELSE